MHQIPGPGGPGTGPAAAAGPTTATTVMPPRPSAPLPDQDGVDLGGYTWAGLDEDFTRDVVAIARKGEGRELAESQVFEIVRAQPQAQGLPLRVRPHLRGELDAFVASYHRVIETVVAAWEHDRGLREVLTLPRVLHEQVAAARDTRVHLLRIDLLPQPDGTLRVLETNANCPGGLPGAGRGRSAWRPLLARHGITLPPPLPADDALWPGSWLLRLAEQHAGGRPETVALLCPDGSYRADTRDYDAALTALGVRVLHADPREVTADGSHGVAVRGEPVRHAFAKVGIQDLLRMGDDAAPYLEAVREGRLFVQNGLRGRLIGDNKLCLAVLSDPRFAHLFDAADYRRVRPAVPWSRNLAYCDAATLRAVLRDRDRYVLKRPLDTRGNGVVIGREVADGSAWEAAVGLAGDEGWLVQEYVTSPHLYGVMDGPAPRHDVALGAVDGRLVSAFARASHGERHNVAGSGRPHPLYL
ncbi:hypothetical protein ABTY61_02290 [Kitasatospora sp. NPDC096128]|uniref:hypothetical protein n=1 Tax=Kitasatospora sp. NPDC096128 TaxID=3155547 RepID=UPI00332B1E1D